MNLNSQAWNVMLPSEKIYVALVLILALVLGMWAGVFIAAAAVIYGFFVGNWHAKKTGFLGGSLRQKRGNRALQGSRRTGVAACFLPGH